MVRSRRLRKNLDKPEWGKNNPQNKEKNRKALIAIGIIAVAAVLISVFLVFGYGSLFAGPAVSPSPSASVTASPSASGSPSNSPSATPAPIATPATSPVGEYSAFGTRILFVTSMGNFTVQMRSDKPITTANFINLTRQGLYDGTIFHRVIAGFMIQGGVVQQNLPTIADEIGNDNQNIIGTIAMAKTDQPNSATSSFFINVANNGQNIADQAGTKFDAVYTVFGKVIGGMDVVMRISNVAVVQSPYLPSETSAPQQTITLIKAIILS